MRHLISLAVLLLFLPAAHGNDKTIAEYSQAIKINPKDAEAYRSRGNAWYMKGLMETLTEFCDSVNQSDKGYYDKAIADYSQVIKINPKDAEAYRIRGFAWRGKGDLDKAIADYSQAIKLNPKDTGAYWGRGRALYMKGLMETLTEFCDSVNKSDKGYYDKAISNFSQSIKLNPKAAESYTDRGQVWHGKKDYDKAIADFSQAIKIHPKDSKVYRRRAQAWKMLGQTKKAAADSAKAEELEKKYE